jgi:cytochrome c oxidase assembly protein subunit 15
LVAIWLFSIAGMVLVMIALGGLTRLTGSGLSIMEWDPLMGILPPLSDAEWHRLFALYRQIPQYHLVNQGFGLDGFKHIFWLEWTHRFWGRLIGLAVLVPLAWFWLRGQLDRRLARGLFGLFLLGALQGAVGWFMVASGFAPDSTAVAPARLAIHLALALVLYGAIVWLAMSVLRPLPRAPEDTALLRRLAMIAAGLVSLTIVAGAFVAGLHAGLAYNTFPLMDGHLVPAGYADLNPFWRNMVQNIATVQFDHRLLATCSAGMILVVLAAGFTIPPFPGLRPRLIALGLAVTLQYTLGVTTLLFVVPIGLAVTHQIGASLLLTALLVLLHALRPFRALAPPR